MEFYLLACYLLSKPRKAKKDKDKMNIFNLITYIRGLTQVSFSHCKLIRVELLKTDFNGQLACWIT